MNQDEIKNICKLIEEEPFLTTLSILENKIILRRIKLQEEYKYSLLQEEKHA